MPANTQLTIGLAFQQSGAGSAAAALDRLKDRAKALERGQLALGVAYGITTAKLLGFVRAGLQGTTLGESMAYNFSMLNREVAQLFLPALEKLNKTIAQTVVWFRNLSGEQQAAIGKWIGIGTGLLGVLSIGPKVVGVLKMIGDGLQTAFTLNPVLLLTSSIVGLMASTEEGRERLVKIGEAMAEVFRPVITLLDTVVLPVVQSLAEFLATAEGAWVGFAVIVLALAPKIVAAVRAMAASFLTLKGALTFGIGALGAVVGLLVGGAKDTREALANVKDLVDSVRSGQLSVEKAKEQAGERIGAETESEENIIARKLMERRSFGQENFKNIFEARKALERGEAGTDLESRLIQVEFDRLQEQRRKETREAGEDIDVAARGGKGRQELTLAKAGFESPADTIRRLQTASLKTDYTEITARNTEKMREKLSAAESWLGKIHQMMKNQQPTIGE